MRLNHRELPIAAKEDTERVGQYIYSNISGRLDRVIRAGEGQMVACYSEGGWTGPLGMVSGLSPKMVIYRALTEVQAIQFATESLPHIWHQWKEFHDAKQAQALSGGLVQ